MFLDKKTFIISIAAVALAAGLLATARSIGAQGNDIDITKKLDEVIAAQKAIVQSIEEIKRDMYIIKIRVTQQQ